MSLPLFPSSILPQFFVWVSVSISIHVSLFGINLRTWSPYFLLYPLHLPHYFSVLKIKLLHAVWGEDSKSGSEKGNGWIGGWICRGLTEQGLNKYVHQKLRAAIYTLLCIMQVFFTQCHLSCSILSLFSTLNFVSFDPVLLPSRLHPPPLSLFTSYPFMLSSSDFPPSLSSLLVSFFSFSALWTSSEAVQSNP